MGIESVGGIDGWDCGDDADDADASTAMAIACRRVSLAVDIEMLVHYLCTVQLYHYCCNAVQTYLS